MRTVISKNLSDAVFCLKENKVVVFPTDTLYGVLTNALCKECVEKVYKIKKRTPSKPYLILVSSIDELSRFKVHINDIERRLLSHGGITVVLDLKEPEKWYYLHRGTNSLAFRIPKKGIVKELLKEVKLPVIAPSANLEGEPPAKNIDEAINYFGEKIDLYFDAGKIKNSSPSTIVKIENGNVKILREGTTSKDQILQIIQQR